MRSPLPRDCAQVAKQLSLREDSELSEFELVLLEAHLARCDDCRAFAEGIAALTKTIRNAPLERPSISFELPRRRARLDGILAASLRIGSAAAAIAVVVVSGVIALNGSTRPVRVSDLDTARSVLDLHERQSVQRGSFGLTARPSVPRGVAAAERVAVRPATRSRRPEGRR